MSLSTKYEFQMVILCLEASIKDHLGFSPKLFRTKYMIMGYRLTREFRELG